jgi:hypothetical protein
VLFILITGGWQARRALRAAAPSPETPAVGTDS